jgi:hypothetical protein
VVLKGAAPTRRVCAGHRRGEGRPNECKNTRGTGRPDHPLRLQQVGGSDGRLVRKVFRQPWRASRMPFAGEARILAARVPLRLRDHRFTTSPADSQASRFAQKLSN